MIDPTKMTKDEWLRRYRQRIVDCVTGEHYTAAEAEVLADAELNGTGYDDLVVGFEDDPEGSADESMSYWSE